MRRDIITTRPDTIEYWRLVDGSGVDRARAGGGNDGGNDNREEEVKEAVLEGGDGGEEEEQAGDYVAER